LEQLVDYSVIAGVDISYTSFRFVYVHCSLYIVDCWQVFAIGITTDIDEKQLKAISSPPHELGQNYVTTPDYTTLMQELDRLITATCTEKPDHPGRSSSSSSYL